MKTTTTRITAVALATAAVCWHQASHAAATPEQLRSVTLYANVSIQEDSTGSWGPWAEFEPPAAGNNPPVAAPRVSTDPYRPLAQTTQPGTTTPPIEQPVEGACAGGSICGFGAFAAGDPNSLKDLTDGETSPEINAFRLNGTAVQGPQGEGSALPQQVQLTATVLSSTGTFQLADSGTLDLGSYGEGGFIYSREVKNNRDQVTESYKIFKEYLGSSAQDNQATTFELATYVRGKGQGGWGVIGYTTPTADMAALRASNAQASYSGSDHYGTPVSMSVNFGNATWSGSWNNGSDGDVSRQSTSSGGTVLSGQVGFTASGTVVGSTFSSNTVGTNDARATVTGSVQGAFFGPNAAAAGGVVDITKTVQPSLQQTAGAVATPQAVPVNANQGYTGRYVAPFIVTRGGNDRRQ